MGFRYVVIGGAGLQGVPIAYDLARFGKAEQIIIVDADVDRVRSASKRLAQLGPAVPVKPLGLRLTSDNIGPIIRDADVVVSALPYHLNAKMARACINENVSYCDLGGSTDVLKEILTLDDVAKRRGITMIPDCGLAPGLNNILAYFAMELHPEIRHVKQFGTGLPLSPRGPLNYRLYFSIEGLTNEYIGKSVVIRNSRIQYVDACTECEVFDGPAELGALESFVTAGATSLAPWNLEGEIETYEYKTVRYQGHFDKIRTMIDLGLLDSEPTCIDGTFISPRKVFHAVVGPRLDCGSLEDLILIRVDSTDSHGRGIRFELIHQFDNKTGFTAMQQGTGFTAAAIAYYVACGEIAPGVRPPEQCGLGFDFLESLKRRGLRIKRNDISM